MSVEIIQVFWPFSIASPKVYRFPIDQPYMEDCEPLCVLGEKKSLGVGNEIDSQLCLNTLSMLCMYFYV